MTAVNADDVLAQLQAAIGTIDDPVELCAIGDRGPRSYTGPLSDGRMRAWVERVGAHEQLYVQPNPLGASYRPGKRCRDADVARTDWLLVDLDPTKDESDPEGVAPHKIDAAALMAQQAARKIGDLTGRYPALIDTGRGTQAWVRDPGLTPDERRRLLRALAQWIEQELPDEKKLAALDAAVANAARLMRCPGGPPHKSTGNKPRVIRPADTRRRRWQPDALRRLRSWIYEHEPAKPEPPPRPKPPPRPSNVPPSAVRDKVEDALGYVPSEEYSTWQRVGGALHYAELRGELVDARGIWDRWSATSPKYNPRTQSQTWASFSAAGSDERGVTTLGTVYYLARLHGWRPRHLPRLDAPRPLPKTPQPPKEPPPKIKRDPAEDFLRPRYLWPRHLEKLEAELADRLEAEEPEAKLAHRISLHRRCCGKMATIVVLNAHGQPARSYAPRCRERTCGVCEAGLLRDYREAVATRSERQPALVVEVPGREGETPQDLGRRLSELKAEAQEYGSVAGARLMAPDPTEESPDRGRGLLVIRPDPHGSMPVPVEHLLGWASDHGPRIGLARPRLRSGRDLGLDLLAFLARWHRAADDWVTRPSVYAAMLAAWKGVPRQVHLGARGSAWLPPLERAEIDDEDEPPGATYQITHCGRVTHELEHPPSMQEVVRSVLRHRHDGDLAEAIAAHETWEALCSSRGPP